jgi:stage II sporulation protein D
MPSGSVFRALRHPSALLAVLAAGAALPAAAQASPLDGHGDPQVIPHVAEPSVSGFYIRGGGDGHGIGLSQYGTLGYAQHGWSYSRILAHYYEGTTIGSVSPSTIIRVLLEDGSASFSGADSKVGTKTLKPATTYAVRPAADGKMDVLDGATKVAEVSSPLTVSGPGPLTVAGLGQYRGDLVFRPDSSGGVQTVNALDIEDYVRGVISAEMPSSWPAQALRAQAVAARTYALTSGSVSSTFDVYSDTRSQMYEGVAAETPATDAAVAATRGQAVTYHGVPVVTYFFSSSGGHTESIQNVWLGSSPEPWLRGVPDPYDGAGGNPNHRWAYNLSVPAAARRLRGLIKGSLVGIRVLKHGTSPRIVEAAVVGTGGSTEVTGPALQQDFGLMSTYMAFTTVSTRGAFSASTSGGSGSGGASTGAGPSGRRSLSGRVFPTQRGVPVLVQRLEKRGWKTVGRAHTVNGGHYTAGISGPGRYRIKYGEVGGPALTMR